MKAFVVKVEQLFRMDTESQGSIHNFNEEKRRLLIPMYQREYTWSDDKIITLINDIRRCNKYLGNVILDEGERCYEIVDGQQRITTCFLILSCLYNKYNGQMREQALLKRLIKPYDEFVLVNDSVGDYINEIEGKLLITIEQEKDIYYQEGDFRRAYETISEEIEKIGNHTEILEFKRKMLDCELLVLINDQHDNTHPVEQLFLDINEKAQLLEVEDIFKGHCFENYAECFHNDLRMLWIELKKCAMGFKRFGFGNTSQYIYLYLLKMERGHITANLSFGGKHYLDGKSMDETEDILNNMIEYGKTNLELYSNLSNTEYRFVDLCRNSYEYRHTGDHLILKQMCKKMLENTAAQYQKFPLLFFTSTLRKNEELAQSMTHVQFRKIITNLYVYMMLFVMKKAKKSKDDIDYTVKNALESEEGIVQVIVASRNLRKQKVAEFVMPENIANDNVAFIYSIIDGYESNENWLKKIYSNEDDYTLEHFIIPDNRNRKVCWNDGDNTFEFVLSIGDVRKYKKKTINYLFLPKRLNEELEHDDIVSKIRDIKLWYVQRGEDLPRHVSEVIGHIERMTSYIELARMKDTECSHEAIKQKYNIFIQDYFDQENGMHGKLQSIFVASFANG